MPSSVTRKREPDDEVYDDDAEELVGELQRAAATRNAVPKIEITNAIDRLSQHASVRGLSAEPLEALVDILTSAPCYIDQTSMANIIKVLLPREKVSEDVVIKVVGCLGPEGPNKPPLGIQALLLRWLVMVYDFLHDYTVLSKLYGVLFNFLDMITLRAHLCHLLSLLTRRKHVKPFRIQALLELKLSVGNEQPLNGLLQIYKNYYPDVIVGEAGPVKSGIFSHPNPDWLQKLQAIQESAAANRGTDPENSAFRVARKAAGLRSKRRKSERVVIPELHTFQAVESSVTLEEVENVDDFVEKLDKLELPNQLAAALDDSLLRKLLQLRPSDSATARLNDWLAAYLSDELRISKLARPGALSRTSDLLSKIVQYTHATGEMLPAVENFLREYLRLWNGQSNIDSILILVTFTPLKDFAELSENVFNPLENTIRRRNENLQAMLLDTYSELLRRWTVAYGDRAPKTVALDKATSALRRFVEHVGRLSLDLLQRTNQNALIADAVLTFYEQTSSLPWRNSLFRIFLPPDSLVYHFVFAGDAMMLSRICGILSRYKRAFELSLKTQGPPGDTGEYPRLYVDHFNGFLMDICNCLWRNRAFVGAGSVSKQDQNAMGCTLTEDVVKALQVAAAARNEAIVSLFSLSHSAVLALLSATCFRAMEDANRGRIRTRHVGAVTQKSLGQLAKNGGFNITYSEYRVAVLNDLGRKGLIGIWDFMHSTMFSLIQSTASNSRFSTRAPVRG